MARRPYVSRVDPDRAARVGFWAKAVEGVERRFCGSSLEYKKCLAGIGSLSREDHRGEKLCLLFPWNNAAGEHVDDAGAESKRLDQRHGKGSRRRGGPRR